jgi:hypothetical protein
MRPGGSFISGIVFMVSNLEFAQSVLCALVGREMWAGLTRIARRLTGLQISRKDITMLGFATIRKDDFPKEWLDRDRWRSLIGEFPELRRKDHMLIGGERYEVPDSAEFLENGEVVGAFIWENGQIYVDGPGSMFSLAKAIADILDARVLDDDGNEMLEPPEELDLPTKPQRVSYHQYDQPLDLLGKDLISRLDCLKADLTSLVGAMIPRSEMKLSLLPATKIASMTGQLADEVHEWPNAKLGREFRHLVLLFRKDRLVGMRWSHKGEAKASHSQQKPWWKLW